RLSPFMCITLLCAYFLFCSMIRRRLSATLFPYTTLFRSRGSGGLLLLPQRVHGACCLRQRRRERGGGLGHRRLHGAGGLGQQDRSEEHTSELQSRFDLVCRLLLEKKTATQ